MYLNFDSNILNIFHVKFNMSFNTISYLHNKKKKNVLLFVSEMLLLCELTSNASSCTQNLNIVERRNPPPG